MACGRERNGAALRRFETARTAGAVPLALTRFDLPAHAEPDPVSDNFVLCLALRGTVRARFQFGEGWREAVVGPGSFMPITPPRVLGELEMDAPHRHLMLALPDRAVAEMGGDGFGALHGQAFRDHLVARICLELWQEARGGNAAGDLFADCARAALVAALRRRARQRPPAAKDARFSAREWARVAALVEDGLGEKLTVAMLAAAAGMGETRFLRAFRAQTGMAPHQYVMRRRLERARGMLGTRMTLADIALAAGFCDQAHMTGTFARVLGRTPGEMRQG